MSNTYQKRDFNKARETLAKLLKDKRQDLKMTQIEFCEYLERYGMEVSYGFLQSWERPNAKGKRKSSDTALPGLVNFEGLSKLFGYPTMDAFYNYLTGVKNPESEMTYEDLARKASQLNKEKKLKLMIKLQSELINNSAEETVSRN